jgi:fatty acid desaturase
MLDWNPRAFSIVGTDRKPGSVLTLSTDVRTHLPGGSEFAALCRQIRQLNLLERRYGSYSLRIATTLVAFAAAWAVFVWLGDSWFQLIVAGALGVLFTQVAFLGHDGGHQQVWRTRRANDLLTIFAGNLLTGLSFGWWIDKHNRHHSHPNHEGQDPDIGDGVLAFTTDQVAAKHDGLGRFIARNQAVLFFPLLMLEGLNLHVASARYLIDGSGGRAARYRALELVLFVVHVVAYVAALLLVLEPLTALAFFAVHQAVFGLYMGCSFAPNHKGMPTIAPGGKVDFLRRQVLTSRNVRGGWFTDQLLGGLNYQVEHHLFPSMPRANLRKAQAVVRAHCAAHRISYTETSLFGSYAMVLRHLHDLGAPLRRRSASVS